MNKKIKKVLVLCTVFLVLTLVTVSAQEDNYETPASPEDIPEVTPGVIGAVCGVFVAVYVRFKLKEQELRDKGTLADGQKLSFNLKRYGGAGLIGLILDLGLQVIIPAMRLGSAFSTGDAAIDFSLAFMAGYGATELIKEAMKKLPFVETFPQQKVLTEQVMG